MAFFQNIFGSPAPKPVPPPVTPVPAQLPRITAPTAAQVCQEYKPKPPAQALLTPQLTPPQYLDALQKQQPPVPEESVNFLAYGLTERESVWWATQCARKVGSPLNLPDESAIKAADAWVKNPTETNRQLAGAAAARTDFQTPGAWAAQAAAWTKPAVPAVPPPPPPPPGTTPPPPPPRLPPHAVAGAVMLAIAVAANKLPAVPKAPAPPGATPPPAGAAGLGGLAAPAATPPAGAGGAGALAAAGGGVPSVSGAAPAAAQMAAPAAPASASTAAAGLAGAGGLVATGGLAVAAVHGVSGTAPAAVAVGAATGVGLVSPAASPVAALAASPGGMTAPSVAAAAGAPAAIPAAKPALQPQDLAKQEVSAQEKADMNKAAIPFIKMGLEIAGGGGRWD